MAMLVLGLAAANTGNNALVMLLGIAMGAFVFSGTWSRQVLGHVTARCERPRRLHAGTPALFDVEIVNGSRLFPAYGLVIRDGRGRRLLFEEILRPRDRRRRVARLVPERRGWNVIGPWRLEVLLPLGFFLKTKQVGEASRVLVYPKLADAGAESLGVVDVAGRSISAHGRGREGEVLQLRPFEEGDEERQVHWKQTARQQKLITVERRATTVEPVFVVVDPRVADPESAAVRARFERMISAAATTVFRRLHAGLPVGVVVGRQVTQPSAQPSHLGRLLAPLALAEPQPLSAPPPAEGPRTILLRAEETAA